MIYILETVGFVIDLTYNSRYCRKMFNEVAHPYTIVLSFITLRSLVKHSYSCEVPLLPHILLPLLNISSDISLLVK